MEQTVSAGQIRVGQELWDEVDERWLRITRIDQGKVSLIASFEMGRWGSYSRVFGSIRLQPGRSYRVRQIVQQRLF